MSTAARLIFGLVASVYLGAALLPCASEGSRAWDAPKTRRASARSDEASPAHFQRYCPCRCGSHTAGATAVGDWQGPPSDRVVPSPTASPSYPPRAPVPWASRVPSFLDPIPIS